MTTETRKGQSGAVVILSGGLDSATCLGIACAEGHHVTALSFDYGQRHRRELDAAARLAKHYGVSHRVFTLPFFREMGGSALTDDTIAVPTEGVDPQRIPSTYVPGRNLIFLSIATALAEVTHSEWIYIGVNALDYSGYPDCRPEFMDAFAKVATLATRAGVEGMHIAVKTPLLHMTKAEIVAKGTELHVPYELTTSCYAGEEEACGVCDSCRLRLAGFAEAGRVDPIRYRSR
ncbi:7-cyano-7-deazaguanine synthase QueC [Ferroacidibacillus organovorans]|uniref:7-cyano-7-deazaguanine synthase n=1 Tax=Ferroacidibacillus organovorans TaxID=1765683 RepID=A0A124IW14_9BACL|nr:7-cyano-7-deazaguanine synthase QueC [Ferroacidibacillus organovorans]KUO95976.1 7-cyano-7-deazaguanine synthase [Ferroacidibacillus organovorans]